MGRKGKETGAGVKIVIMDLMRSGISRRKLSEMLKIIKSTVMDICKKFSDTGSLENKPRSGWPPKSSPVINENQKGLLKQIGDVPFQILLLNLTRKDLNQ